MGIDAVMLATTSRMYEETELRQLSASLASAVGPDAFVILREQGYPWAPHHALTGESIEDEDGYTDERGRCLRPPVGGHLLRVRLMGRYYGPEYERGDWPRLDAVIRWLLARLPDGRVWYGGDSDSALQEMTPAARKKLWAHWCQVGREPYVRDFGLSTHACEFCGGRPLIHTGGGGRGADAVEFLLCDGCGLKVVLAGPEKVYHELPRHADFFGWREAIAQAPTNPVPAQRDH